MRASGEDVEARAALIVPEIEPNAEKFPYCLVWTPLPVVAWLVPFVGHLGICRRDGTILDFVGSYFVNVGTFAFGAPSKYLALKPELACLPANLSSHICGMSYAHAEYGPARTWDEALALSTRQFQHETYNIFTTNCHSFVACALNRLAYGGKMNWTVVDLAVLMVFHGKWVSTGSVVYAYAPFLLVVSLGVYLTGWVFLLFVIAFTLLLVAWFLFGTYVCPRFVKYK